MAVNSEASGGGCNFGNEHLGLYRIYRRLSRERLGEERDQDKSGRNRFGKMEGKE